MGKCMFVSSGIPYHSIPYTLLAVQWLVNEIYHAMDINKFEIAL